MEKTEIGALIFIIENNKKLKDSNRKVNGYPYRLCRLFCLLYSLWKEWAN